MPDFYLVAWECDGTGGSEIVVSLDAIHATFMTNVFEELVNAPQDEFDYWLGVIHDPGQWKNVDGHDFFKYTLDMEQGWFCAQKITTTGFKIDPFTVIHN